METKESSTMEKKRIAIVDDEENIRVSLKAILDQEDYVIDTVASGEEALELIAREKVDLIVADYSLPGIDGIKTIIKAREISPDIGAILMTGVGAEKTIIESFTTGKADYYLPKPFSMKEVRRVVALVLREAEVRWKDHQFQEELRNKVQEATAELKEKNRLLEQKEKETASLNEMLKNERAQLQEANESLTRLNQELERLSVTDGLTKLYNFRYFSQRLNEEFLRAQRYETKLSLLMLDIDDFKRTNDVYGHLAGDEVLRKVAEALVSSSRQVDMAVRYGGEEFVLLMPEVGLAGAAVRAERLRKAIESNAIEYKGEQVSITISIGVSSYDAETMTKPQELVSSADKALYRAKDLGKNCVVMAMDERLKAVGRESVVTDKECLEIQRAVMDFACSNCDAEGILHFLVTRLGEALEDDRSPVYISVWMKDEEGAIVERASLNGYTGSRDIASVAGKVMKENRPVILDSEQDPITCFPIRIRMGWEGEEETAGALVMNRIPSALDHISSLLIKLSPIISSATFLEKNRLEALKQGEKSRRYLALSRLFQKLAKEDFAMSAKKALSAIAEDLTETLRAEAVSVYTYSSMTRGIGLLASVKTPVSAIDDKKLSSAGKALAVTMAESFRKKPGHEPVVVDDIKSLVGHVEDVEDETVYMCVPIEAGGELAGVMIMAYPLKSRPLKDEDKDLAKAAASLFSALLFPRHSSVEAESVRKSAS